MTFLDEVKKELAQKTPPNSCCKASLLYGILLFSNVCYDEKFELKVKYEELSSLISKISLSLFGKKPQITNANKYIIDFSDDKIIEKMTKIMPSRDVKEDMPFLKKQCCISSFLRGAFFACGHLTDPKKGYHMDFENRNETLILNLINTFSHFGFQPKKGLRKWGHIAYFKSSAEIEDALNIIGATFAALKIMELKVVRDVRNTVNRQVNCETANISKTVMAAKEQRDAINIILEKTGIESLPFALQEAINARLENPDASFQELSEIMGGISRSGLSHRFKKLISLAKELS